MHCIYFFKGMVSYARRSTLNIYGASDKRRELEPLLIWATPGQRGFPPTTASSRAAASAASTSTRIGGIAQATPSSSQRRSNASQTPAQMEAIRKQLEALQKATELRQMLSNLEKVDDEGRRSSMLDTLCSVDDILSLPLHPSPPGILNGELTVDLLKHQVCLRFSPLDRANLCLIHQLQALQWCVEHESPVLPREEKDKPVQFWQLRKNGSKVSYLCFKRLLLYRSPSIQIYYYNSKE